MRIANWIGFALHVIALSTVGVFVLLIVWIPINLYFFNSPCMTRVLERKFNVFGYDLLVSETNCDFIAKEPPVVSVLVAKAGSSNRILLFEYDAVVIRTSIGGVPLSPTLRFDTPTVLTISIHAVNSIFYQLDQWENLSVWYEIGRVRDTETKEEQQRRYDILAQTGPSGENGPSHRCADRFGRRRQCQLGD